MKGSRVQISDSARKKAAGHVRRPFYVQGGPESSEGGRNRSAPGTGRKPQTGRNAAPAIRTGPGTDRNDSRKPKKTPGRAGRHPGNPKPGLPNRNAAGGTKRTPCHPKAGGSGRKGPAAPRKSGKIEKPSEQLKTGHRPAGGRYDFSERKPAETRCRKRPIRNSTE